MPKSPENFNNLSNEGEKSEPKKNEEFPQKLDANLLRLEKESLKKPINFGIARGSERQYKASHLGDPEETYDGESLYAKLLEEKEYSLIDGKTISDVGHFGSGSYGPSKHTKIIETGGEEYPSALYYKGRVNTAHGNMWPRFVYYEKYLKRFVTSRFLNQGEFEHDFYPKHLIADLKIEEAKKLKAETDNANDVVIDPKPLAEGAYNIFMEIKDFRNAYESAKEFLGKDEQEKAGLKLLDQLQRDIFNPSGGYNRADSSESARFDEIKRLQAELKLPEDELDPLKADIYTRMMEQYSKYDVATRFASENNMGTDAVNNATKKYFAVEFDPRRIINRIDKIEAFVDLGADVKSIEDGLVEAKRSPKEIVQGAIQEFIWIVVAGVGDIPAWSDEKVERNKDVILKHLRTAEKFGVGKDESKKILSTITSQYAKPEKIRKFEGLIEEM